jgi:ferredoxin-NADP reductase
MWSRMIELVDTLLNGITMYRLVLYVLIFLLAVAGGLGAAGILAFPPEQLAVSVAFLLFMCWAANTTLSWAFEAPTNTESVYITALILALIITPPASGADLPFLGWAAVLSMASKYLFAVKNKLVFNPAALAVVVTSLFAGQSASWWVGTAAMLPFVSVSGLLVVRKIRRTDLMGSFLVVAVTSIVGSGILRGSDIIALLKNAFVDSPLIFFSTIMLTEPLTTPPTTDLRMLYGLIVGLLYSPQLRVAGVSSTPELALVVGNIASWLMSPKYREILKLREKIRIAPDVYDFVFAGNGKLRFSPGQYMEWTLPHPRPDDRGNRRYFTIASSPTERDVRVGVKLYPNGSSYKRSMAELGEGSRIVAAQLAGDFTLPSDRSLKLAFIAGGIGITPFRSMAKYLVDTHDTRSVVLVYSNRTADEIVYGDVFDAAREVGMKTYYTLTDKTKVPAGWQGPVGRVDADMIRTLIPDYGQRVFYVSGTHAMTVATQRLLGELGVPSSMIKTDFFPGFA